YLYERSYVLESRGELLWVSVHILMHYPDKGKNGVNDLVDALSMSMHTLEEVTKETEKLLWTRKDGRSLEDRVLFLGWPNSFALDASRLGMSGGFAYFLYYDDQGGCRLHERHGVFRHNLIDNTTEFVEWLPQGWDKEMCVWLLPQLTIAPVNQGPATTSRSNNTCAGVLMPNLLQEEDRDFTGYWNHRYISPEEVSMVEQRRRRSKVLSTQRMGRCVVGVLDYNNCLN
uniref:KIB1-4 beta-propeller domain-containing protein n=1 Tax=Aegilops tauschii subsp. strangulata TaxID=200361 RepID=A0A453GWF6_AEGTS